MISGRASTTFLLLSCALTSFILAATYSSARNTLRENGSWRVTEAESDRSVAHGNYFYSTRKALHKNRLDLGAWHGSNELILKRPVSLSEARFTAVFSKNSYLIFEFNRDHKGYSGLRLSASPLFSSAYLEADTDGAFLTTVPFPAEIHAGKMYEVTVRLHDDLAELFLDGRKLHSQPVSPLSRYQIGFRNGMRSVLIDDVVLTDRNGETVFREDFREWDGFLPVFFVTLGVSLAGAWLFPNPAAWVTTHAVASICVGMFHLVDHFHLSGLYEKQYSWLWFRNYNDREYAERSRRILSQEHSTSADSGAHRRPELGKNHYRVLFLGGSQTWGEGAASVDDTWVSRIQKKFDSAFGPTRRMEVLNAAQPGANSTVLLRTYLEKWVNKDLDLAVLNVSNNDGNVVEFERSLSRLIKIIQDRGIRILLVLEPNDPEVDDSHLARNHAVMRTLARERSLPLVEMHEYFSSSVVYDSGLMWWDYVHLTSYGQRRFADHLFPRVIELLH